MADPDMTDQQPAPSADFTISGPLSDDDRAVLDLERLWWKYAGAKEQAIRDRFDISAVRFHQVLNALIDREEALAHDPILVKRLQGIRADRQWSRSARRLGL